MRRTEILATCLLLTADFVRREGVDYVVADSEEYLAKKPQNWKKLAELFRLISR